MILTELTFTHKMEEKYESLTCSICFIDINSTNIVNNQIYQCNHSKDFCLCCIKKCIEKFDTCPLCRAQKKLLDYSTYSLEEKHKFLIEIIESEDCRNLDGKKLHTFIEQAKLAEDMNFYEFISSKTSEVDKTYTSNFKNIIIQKKKNFQLMEQNWDFTCSILMNLYH